VPTVVLLHESAASLDGICDAQGWNTVVVKPAVGIGGEHAGRFDVGDTAGQTHLDELLARGDVIVQPYLASVERDGELSIVCFDGVPSHSVRKRPRAGEYRVQEQYGGTNDLVDAPTGAAALAARVCNVLPARPCYARIDLLGGSADWQIVEVEATEPSLFLDLAGDRAVDAMVRAITARLQ
jgi:glutathione synthase/RimK-type ligase-like ATP-grasp enzyme